MWNGIYRSANRKIFDKKPEHRNSTRTYEKASIKKIEAEGKKSRRAVMRINKQLIYYGLIFLQIHAD